MFPQRVSSSDFHCHCGMMELHPTGDAESQEERLPSSPVFDRVSPLSWIPSDIFNILKMVLSTMERVDFHELLSLPLEMLICKAREWVVLS